jgi:hypothetical protein
MHSGICLLDTNRRASLGRLLLDGLSSPDDAPVAIRNTGGARLGRRLLHSDSVTLAIHPYQKVAAFQVRLHQVTGLRRFSLLFYGFFNALAFSSITKVFAGGEGDIGGHVCVYYCSTYYKDVRVGGGG